LLAQLANVKWKDKPCWTSPEVPGAYRAEYMAFAQEYLFLEGHQHGSSRRSYLQLDSNIHNQIFGNFIALDYDQGSNRKERRPSVKTFCSSAPGVELFLSNAGSGVLSLTFSLGEGEKAAITFESARQFNYALSHSGRRNVPYLRRPHPELDTHLLSEKVTVRNPVSNEPDLLKRLGQFGSSFSIEELAGFLLQPVLSSPGFSFLQKQSSVYSVGVFPSSGALDSDAETTAAFLAALAQIEEPGHPGTPIDITRFSSHHWSASSSLASAHLATNQGVPFDQQRSVTLRDKYFVCYLLALLQRATIYRLQVKATSLIRASNRDRQEISLLRRDALGFLLVGDWTEISARDVINRYYEQCRQALRIVSNMTTVTTAIAEFDAVDRSEAQQQTLNALRDSQHEQHETLLALERTQNKLEWIEILIVGIYLAEFVHLVCEALHLPSALTVPSIVGSALAGMWTAHWVLRPNAIGEDPNLPARRKTAVAAGLGLLIVWLALMLYWREGESAGLHTWHRALEERYERHAQASTIDPARERKLRKADTALSQAAGELVLHSFESARTALEQADEAVRELERHP